MLLPLVKEVMTAGLCRGWYVLCRDSHPGPWTERRAGCLSKCLVPVASPGAADGTCPPGEAALFGQVQAPGLCPSPGPCHEGLRTVGVSLGVCL